MQSIVEIFLETLDWHPPPDKRESMHNHDSSISNRISQASSRYM